MSAVDEAWPPFLEEVRVLTGAAGRSVPEAIYVAGRRTPPPLRDHFARGEREWTMTLDLRRSVQVVRSLVQDPEADLVLEQLVLAHEIGVGDLDRRLAALLADRLADLDARRQAEAELAGARFARRFVLLVPIGMALAGTTVGGGPAAWLAPEGRPIVVACAAMVVGCWAWAGRLMRPPTRTRVASTGVHAP